MIGTQAETPIDLLLEATKETLDLLDFNALIGVPDVKIRHRRFRNTTVSEVPCLSVVFLDDDDQGSELNRNEWELCRVMSLELWADFDLDPEDSGLDPTGVGQMGRALAAAVKAMQDPTSPLGRLVDYVRPSSIRASDQSQSDKGRLVRAVDVQYRVRSDDQNVLLAVGVSG